MTISAEVTTDRGYHLYRRHQEQYATVHGEAPDGTRIDINTQYEVILGPAPEHPSDGSACEQYDGRPTWDRCRQSVGVAHPGLWPLGGRDSRWDPDKDHIIAAARALLAMAAPIEAAQAERLREESQEALSVERRIERLAASYGQTF